MSTISITAKKDFLQSLATARKPADALAELVWNGLDAQSNRVRVAFELNALDEIQCIRVTDYGTGIRHDEVTEHFGNLGESWKKLAPQGKGKGRVLHGKNGRGRFKAFALGGLVEWSTTFIKDAL